MPKPNKPKRGGAYTSAAPPPPPPPPPGPTTSGVTDYPIQFGFSPGNLQNLSASNKIAELNVMQDLNSRWCRIDINWAQIQRNGVYPGYDWSNIDAAVTGAIARGMKVIGTIAYTPGWHKPNAYNCPDPSVYASFCAVAAKHYYDLGVRVFEIWNEPNIPFMSPPNVANYTAILKAAYPVIKYVTNGDCVVLNGGFSPAGDSGGNISPKTFLKGIYANGGGDSFDHLSHHPYMFGYVNAPTGFFGYEQNNAWTQMAEGTESLRSILNSKGHGHKKIWGTEFGAPTAGSPSITPTQQASLISQAMGRWKQFSWAGPLLIYSLADRAPASDTSNYGDHFGIVESNWTTKKPAYNAFLTGNDRL